MPNIRGRIIKKFLYFCETRKHSTYIMSYQKFFNPEEAYTRSEIEALQLERL